MLRALEVTLDNATPPRPLRLVSSTFPELSMMREVKGSSGRSPRNIAMTSRAR